MPIAILVVFLISIAAYRMIRVPLKKAMDDLEKFSQGDLTVKLKPEMLKRNDELGVISRSMETMTSKFDEIIIGIKQSFDGVSRMSENIKQASSNMAQSTAMQASNLEEISTSMEEMVETITQNSENAQETKDITEKTNDSVKIGNESVLKALNYLNDIADKIKVINDISYQTNILALNAGVEAARAGELGRGFAVVATEVRNLSSQSKVAAVEIDGVSKEGTSFSNEAIESLKDILPNMEMTNMLVQKIVMANSEQSSGVSHINNAIQELNNATQQNATDAEEMAQSAISLTNEALQLQELIKFFKTN